MIFGRKVFADKIELHLMFPENFSLKHTGGKHDWEK